MNALGGGAWSTGGENTTTGGATRPKVKKWRGNERW